MKLLSFGLVLLTYANAKIRENLFIDGTELPKQGKKCDILVNGDTVFMNCLDSQHLMYTPKEARFSNFNKEAISSYNNGVQMLSKSVVGGFTFYDQESKTIKNQKITRGVNGKEI